MERPFVSPSIQTIFLLMMKAFKPINHSSQIRITTQTPLSIGSGQILSPYADYVYDADKDEAYLINKPVFEAAIMEKGLLDEYIDMVTYTFGNNRSEFNLKTFIEGRSGLGFPENIYQTQSVQCDGLRQNLRREVKTIIKDVNRPYVPGSTIKGAIKAAILYDWLRKDGKKHLDEIMRKVLGTFENCRSDIESIDRISKRRSISREDRKEIFRLMRNIARKGVSKLSKDIDEVIAQLLAEDSSYFPKSFSFLKVGDSKPLREEDVVFQLTKRLHYSKRILSIPIYLETITTGTESSFRLSIEPSFQEEYLEFMNSDSGIKDLFLMVNKFHKDNIDMEMEQLDRFYQDRRMRQADKKAFERYEAFLEKQYELIDNCSHNEAYLCLGFGKSFFYNSIGMLVFDWKEDDEPLAEKDYSLFRKYCKLFFLGRMGQRNFPLTRLVTRQGIPMGWVKLEILG